MNKINQNDIYIIYKYIKMIIPSEEHLNEIINCKFVHRN